VRLVMTLLLATSAEPKSTSQALHDAVHRILARMYQPRAYWWESVQMIHRLQLAILVTMASSVPVVRAFLSTAVCTIALVRRSAFLCV
jgi:hypothetical protein